jgi:hypothetical protein
MQIEKFISYQIENQFPAIYREDGEELVNFMRSYYEFLESDVKQSVYVNRRLYEYRDIDTTLESLLIFYQKKYLSDLPFNQDNIRFIVKHILDLYRRKGTEEGLKLFFRLFYEESAEVFYPSEAMLKPSESTWNVIQYIQLFPGNPTDYRDLVGRRIFGTVSKAEATVNKILFMFLNGQVVPVLFLNNVKGSFVGFDNIITRFDDGSIKTFGRVYGSLTSVEVDRNFENATTGNSIGDILEIDSTRGEGAKLIVTDVNTQFTGQILYRVDDGGWGYTIDDTLLLVSDQIIFLSESSESVSLEPLEVISDDLGNQGIFIGRNGRVVGVKMNDGDDFIDGVSVISKSDLTVLNYDFIVSKNNSSPGPLFPTAANNEIDFAVRVGELANKETVSLITDVIGNFLSVTLNSSNYNNVPPALVPMSGSANSVTLSTPLEDAFDLTPFELGSIVNFININPGQNYINDVFAVAHDPVIRAFGRLDQIITLETFSAAFSVGLEISQGSVKGKIRRIAGNSLFVTPYSYYGFDQSIPITFNGSNFNILAISTDFDSRNYGLNANIRTTTDFATGKVLSVNVVDSGFGYIDNSDEILVRIEQVVKLNDVSLISTGDQVVQNNITGVVLSVSVPEDEIIVETLQFDRLNSQDVITIGGIEYEIENIEVVKIPVARGNLSVRGQGFAEGDWSTLESHLNFEDGKVIQDSFFYQDFSYEIASKVNFNDYERPLKELIHVAGTKVFGKFNFEDSLSIRGDVTLDINLNFEEIE